MQLLVVALSIAVFTQVGAKEVAPNAVPSRSSEGSSTRKLNGQQKIDGGKNADAAASPIQPTIHCPNCCPVEQPHTQTKEEEAKAVSLDRLYRRYLCATVIGVIGAFVGIVLLLWQNMLLRQSVIAAKQSADTAERSATFARNAVRDSERADILLEAAGIVRAQSGVVDGDSRLMLRYKNFGRTRAKDVRFKVSMLIEGTNLPNATQHLPTMVMGPGQDQTITFETFRGCLTESTFKQIVQGKITLRFDSLVVYEDVFGGSYTTRDFGIFDHRALSFRMEQQMAG